MAKNLYRVELHTVMMVYAENSEEAEFLFTENFDDEFLMGDSEIFTKKTNHYPKDWEDSIPWGEDGSQTCKEIKEKTWQKD